MTTIFDFTDGTSVALAEGKGIPIFTFNSSAGYVGLGLAPLMLCAMNLG